MYMYTLYLLYYAEILLDKNFHQAQLHVPKPFLIAQTFRQFGKCPHILNTQGKNWQKFSRTLYIIIIMLLLLNPNIHNETIPSDFLW